MLPLAARARHMTDVAYAHTNLAHDDQALDALLSVERMAPSWIRYQAFPRAVVGELLEHERRRNPGLRNQEIARLALETVVGSPAAGAVVRALVDDGGAA